MSLRTEKMSGDSSSGSKTQVSSERQAQIRVQGLAGQSQSKESRLYFSERNLLEVFNRVGVGEKEEEKDVWRLYILSDFSHSKVTSHYMENE